VQVLLKSEWIVVVPKKKPTCLGDKLAHKKLPSTAILAALALSRAVG